MHFIPDTEEEDSAAETFWPEGYKKVIREDFRKLISNLVGEGTEFKNFYEARFAEEYGNLKEFTHRIINMVTIGMGNGADGAFDEIVSAFLTESPLPQIPRYGRYFWPEAFSEEATRELRRVVIDEYSQDNIYQYAYQVGYQSTFRSFDEYMDRVADIVVTGAVNGADDVLGALWRSFVPFYPLPPVRRCPRRLKRWS